MTHVSQKVFLKQKPIYKIIRTVCGHISGRDTSRCISAGVEVLHPHSLTRNCICIFDHHRQDSFIYLTVQISGWILNLHLDAFFLRNLHLHAIIGFQIAYHLSFLAFNIHTFKSIDFYHSHPIFDALKKPQTIILLNGLYCAFPKHGTVPISQNRHSGQCRILSRELKKIFHKSSCKSRIINMKIIIDIIQKMRLRITSAANLRSIGRIYCKHIVTVKQFSMIFCQDTLQSYLRRTGGFQLSPISSRSLYHPQIDG